jgi:hypothetical protein
LRGEIKLLKFPKDGPVRPPTLLFRVFGELGEVGDVQSSTSLISLTVLRRFFYSSTKVSFPEFGYTILP